MFLADCTKFLSHFLSMHMHQKGVVNKRRVSTKDGDCEEEEEEEDDDDDDDASTLFNRPYSSGKIDHATLHTGGSQYIVGFVYIWD